MVNGSGELTTGTQTLYQGTGALLSGILEIYNGSGALVDGTGALDDGVAELLAGIAQLYEGSGNLKDGTGTMRAETSGMDAKIQEQIDQLLRSVTGGDVEVGSFVSDQNTQVERVQFVLKTEGVQKPEPESYVEPETGETTFWQKLAALFGF